MHAPLQRRLAGAALVMVVAACSGAPGASPAPTASPSATTEALTADIDVGGRTLHIVCVGPTDTGRPTVIFEHGLGGDYRQWGDVMSGIKATNRACSYDRAGTGMSEPGPSPWTTADQVEDLKALLEGAAIAPPYILVGFSSGGWNAMVYTDRYPDDVAGVVLVDARHPGASARWLAELPPDAAGESEALRGNRAEFTTFEDDPSLNPEGLNLRASSAQALAAEGFGDRPLEALFSGDTSAIWEGLDADLAARLDAVTAELQDELVAMSTKGHGTTVEDAPHEIPAERPDAVIEAIEAVFAALAG